jgi:hemoglobin
MKKDIETRGDVELLVNEFYKLVKENAKLGYIFTDIAKVNWEAHLPNMYSFWASIILAEHSFSGNPMQKHIELSKITRIEEPEFTEWLKLFAQTVDHFFEGPNAIQAKLRATNIARLMLHKIQTSETGVNF